MGDKDSSNEKREVEEYLKLYCMEECLDEIMNEIILERPTNPYVAMALLCESKTMPEIIDVTFKSVLIGDELAVQANLTTNIATFSGIATYALPAETKELRDYTMLREKVRDAVLDIDPVNITKVDEGIAKLSGVDPAESLALSIACVRAGARHKGMKLYQYIASVSGLKEEDVCIPAPVVSVLSRIVEGQDTQDITLTSTKAGSFSSAMESLLQCASLVARSDGVLKPRTLSAWGSPCITGANVNVAAKLVQTVLSANDFGHDLKQGLHVRSELLLKQPLDPVEPVYQYLLDGLALPPRTGNDLVEILTTLWQDVECVSMDDAVFEADSASVHYFAKRTKEIAYDLKSANSETLKYSMNGVGGDAACHLQVPLDAVAFAEVTDLEQLTQDTPYNCVKLHLSRFPSVSRAVEVVRKARAAKWSVLLVSNCTASLGPETPDTFQADFAVGVGAGQFLMGGLYAAECTAKYNRMMEIAEESPQIRYVGARFRK